METPVARWQLPANIQVIIAGSDEACLTWLRSSRSERQGAEWVLGFDCERNPNTGQPLLLQFSTLTSCMLVRCTNGTTFPSILGLLNSSRVIKAGVHLSCDTSELKRYDFLAANPLVKPSNKKPIPYSAAGWFDVGLCARNVLSIPAPGATELNYLGGNHGIASVRQCFHRSTM